jgi:hypothetical protein
MRRVATLVLFVLLTPPAFGAPAPEADLATGIRQVQEGDFEGAVTTLQGVTRKLAGQASRRQELAQAYLYLGIAHVALDQRDPAKAAFKAALAQNRELRLSPDRFSPKVIGVFEEARGEAASTSATASGGDGSGGKPLLWIALGGAAAGAVVLAASGGDDPGVGPITVSNARFATPVITCPNGSQNVDLPFSVLVDVNNPTSNALAIDAVSTIGVITASPDLPSEVGFSSQRPSSVAPAGVAARTGATLRVTSTLLCGNSGGDPARSNTWLARLSFTTSAGVFNVETADRMRVDVP